jgi:hypothetical protein
MTMLAKQTRNEYGRGKVQAGGAATGFRGLGFRKPRLLEDRASDV